MNRRNVRLVFLREVRDQIRDRRTLFMIVVLPMLLYPGLAIGMVEISFLFREQPRTIVLLGTDNLPADPPLLSDHHFDQQWFAVPDDADKLRVIHDGKPRGESDASGQDKAGPDKPEVEANAVVLDEARQLATKSQELEELEKQLDRLGHDRELGRRTETGRAGAIAQGRARRAVQRLEGPGADHRARRAQAGGRANQQSARRPCQGLRRSTPAISKKFACSSCKIARTKSRPSPTSGCGSC